MVIVTNHLELLWLTVPVVVLSDNITSSTAGDVGKALYLLQIAASAKSKSSMLVPNVSSTRRGGFVAKALSVRRQQGHVRNRNMTRRMMSLVSILTKESDLSTDALVCGSAFAVLILLCMCYSILNSRPAGAPNEKKSKNVEASLKLPPILSNSTGSLEQLQRVEKPYLCFPRSPESIAGSREARLPEPLYRGELVTFMARFKILCTELENARAQWPADCRRKEICIWASGEGDTRIVLNAVVEKPDLGQGSVALSKPGAKKRLAVFHFLTDSKGNHTRLLVDEEGSEYGILYTTFKHRGKCTYVLNHRVDVQAIDFEPGKMGIHCDENGVVQKVIPDSQAHCNGIRKNHRILKVGTSPFSQDALNRAEGNEGSYQVTVKKGMHDHHDPALMLRSSGDAEVSLHLMDNTMLARTGRYSELLDHYFEPRDYLTVRVDLGTDPVLVLLCILGVIVFD